jgi:hypothetical protein
MADLTLIALVSRDLLGLGALNINDHENYRVAPGFLGGQVTWVRSTAASPYMDDEVTVHRRRGKVTEPVVVEVLSGDAGTSTKMQSNVNALVQAFSQDNFTLDVTVNGQKHTYSCEAADFQIAWTGPRLVAKQLQVAFQMPRAPVPIVGVV